MIGWSSHFAIGILRIDVEHEMLFAMISDFEKARLIGSSDDVLLEHLTEISAFAKYQFLAEEHILARRGFADLDDHRRKHGDFLDLIFNLSLSQRLGRSTFDGSATLLENWLSNHIEHDDAKFAPSGGRTVSDGQLIDALTAPAPLQVIVRTVGADSSSPDPR